MKILIVSASFYPRISPRSFRTTELVTELRRLGHSVTLVTENGCSKQSELIRELGIKHIPIKSKEWSDIKLRWNGLPGLVLKVVRRSLYYFFYYPKISYMWRIFKTLKDVEYYDLIISIASPHSIHWGVAWSSSTREIAKNWIADCGDPFMGQENDSFRPIFYFKYLEKWFCDRANFITVPLEDARDAYYRDYRGKIRVIPQSIDMEGLVLREYERRNHIPTFAYGGGFIPGKRDPRPLLEFLLGLERDFRFHIYTSQREFIIEFCERSDGRIIVHDLIPRKELITIMSGMDFLINIRNIGSKQSPSKIIDYAISGRPVLDIKSFELDRERLLAFLEYDFSGAMKVPEIGQFDIKKITRQFLELVKSN